MKTTEVLRLGREIVINAGLPDPDFSIGNFLDFAEQIKDVIASWSKLQREEATYLKPFAEKLRELRDFYEDEVTADPLIQYLPAHAVSLAFHKSLALIRYFRGGNRISKTESARFDIYAVTTGQMIFRPAPPSPANAFIIGTNFSQYGEAVFEKKYIIGESGNPMTPAFPKGGKWFNSYDDKKHILTLACSECAELKRAGLCAHTKSTIQLFSDKEGPDVLAGGQYAIGQFDEYIDEEFLGEGLKRLESVPNSSLMVTETPLRGKGAWQHQKLTLLYEEGPPSNTVDGDPARPMVSLHTIDQFEAGLVPHDRIRASMKVMSPAEIEARVYGRPAAFSETGVFDAMELARMYDDVANPLRVRLYAELPKKMLEEDKALKKLTETELLIDHFEDVRIRLEEHPEGAVRIWEHPKPYIQYAIGADVAQGLRGRDYSCAQVARLTRKGIDIHFDQVAQYHGHINSHTYADELVKLAHYYNDATVIVERRGPGDATLHRLVQDFVYVNTFRDISDPAQATFIPDALYGVDTDVKTKGVIISLLQNVIKSDSGKRTIKLRDFLTLEELGHYGQEQTQSKLTYRFRGEGGMNDDRVMGLALLVYPVLTFPELYDLDIERAGREAAKKAVAKDKDSKEFWRDVERERLERKRELDSW